MPDNKKHWSVKLRNMEACTEAVEWAREYANFPTAWNACERGDWLGWLLGELLRGKKGPENRGDLVRASCDCAELVIHLVPSGEDHPRKAIETTREWSKGKATDEQVAAFYASYAASYSASYAASAASYSASYAASAASYASYAASYASAASAASYAAYAASASYVSYASARSDVLKQCADIFRKYYSAERVVEMMEEYDA